MHDNLDDELKELLKIEDKKKEGKCENLNVEEKEQWRKYKKKKGRKLYMITLAMMKKNRLEKMIKKKDGQTFTNFK